MEEHSWKRGATCQINFKARANNFAKGTLPVTIYRRGLWPCETAESDHEGVYGPEYNLPTGKTVSTLLTNKNIDNLLTV